MPYRAQARGEALEDVPTRGVVAEEQDQEHAKADEDIAKDAHGGQQHQQQPSKDREPGELASDGVQPLALFNELHAVDGHAAKDVDAAKGEAEDEHFQRLIQGVEHQRRQLEAEPSAKQRAPKEGEHAAHHKILAISPMPPLSLNSLRPTKASTLSSTP